MIYDKRVVLLVGGVGGAKLAFGLAHIVTSSNLTIIVNTADDFWHYGLRICPDMDTVMYTLSGRVDRVNGWGISGDTTAALEMLREYGEPTWFRLGDKDIATHLMRTLWLRQGLSLTQITRRLTQALGIECTVLPMTDMPVATIVDTIEYGELAFQDYFVRHRWQPTVRGLRLEGIEDAAMTPEVKAALHDADLIVIGPSNPWLSIQPILSVPGMRGLLETLAVPRLAVTPIVEGRAVKGPAAKIMSEMGLDVSVRSVMEFYSSVTNGFVYDVRDNKVVIDSEWNVAFDTIMELDEHRIALAQQILDWAFSRGVASGG